MAVKNSEITAFFEQLAQKHKKINHSSTNKHFYRMELNDFVMGISGFKGFNMILEVMPLKYDGNNNDNAFKIREVAFIIVKSLPSINKEYISAAFDECEAIVDDILSKLNNARCGFNSTVISYDPSSIDAHQLTDGKNFGVRCLVDVKSPHSFDVVLENWNP
jgi:hypothetical protein